jgi:hypothetical protein
VKIEMTFREIGRDDGTIEDQIGERKPTTAMVRAVPLVWCRPLARGGREYDNRAETGGQV